MNTLPTTTFIITQFKRTYFLQIFVLACVVLFASNSNAGSYGQYLCRYSGYTCLQVEYGDSWSSLFSDPDTRDLVQRINRTNKPLHTGMIIAVPDNLTVETTAVTAESSQYSPFAQQISAIGNKTILVDPNIHAWAAYNSMGQLVRWGPASLGKNYCPDIRRGCRTVTGTFKIFNKGGSDCISSKFPLPYGGAPMPYCMHFHKGFALHGSYDVPGYNASHGCVRLIVEDARWLNQEFANYGTTVIVRPYKM